MTAVDRSAQIQGLRDLADFLDAHPSVPMPSFTLIVAYEGPDALAEWVDGLDELELEPGPIDAHRMVVRRFAGLRVPAIARASQLGTVHEVESTVIATKLVPLTPAEIIDRAREAVSA